jgi:hypothetical protein
MGPQARANCKTTGFAVMNDDVIKKAKERAKKPDKASSLSWRPRVSERSGGYREINEVVKLRQNEAGRDFGADSEMGGVAENKGIEITSKAIIA